MQQFFLAHIKAPLGLIFTADAEQQEWFSGACKARLVVGRAGDLSGKQAPPEVLLGSWEGPSTPGTLGQCWLEGPALQHVCLSPIPVSSSEVRAVQNVSCLSGF